MSGVTPIDEVTVTWLRPPGKRWVGEGVDPATFPDPQTLNRIYESEVPELDGDLEQRSQDKKEHRDVEGILPIWSNGKGNEKSLLR